MSERADALATADAGAGVNWAAFLTPRLALPLAVLLGGVLLHSMNALITATLLPSIVADLGGAGLMSWPTTAFVASSIIAAAATGVVSRAVGSRRAFCGGAVIYAGGAMLCAIAPSFGLVITGRFIQGLGGGLLSALAYVLVRNVFPEPFWPRVFGILSGVWSVSILTGPLIGGLFAGYGIWRGAFVAVSGIGGLLGVAAIRILSADPPNRETVNSGFPAGRVVLICVAIALLSLSSVLVGLAIQTAVALSAIGAFIVVLRIDREAEFPLLPTDAFSLRSSTGEGLWMAFLLSAAYSPLAIYIPLFLQRLHGLNPLPAGYMIATASLAWTTAALSVASVTERWPPRLLIAGPLAMSIGLIGIADLMGPGPIAALLPPIALIGIGIGGCWAFIAQRVMTGAKEGEGNIAAAAIATVQQAGIALGAALAGLIANAGGLRDGLNANAIQRAAFWVPIVFVAAPLAAAVIGMRSNVRAHRSSR